MLCIILSPSLFYLNSFIKKTFANPEYSMVLEYLPFGSEAISLIKFGAYLTAIIAILCIAVFAFMKYREKNNPHIESSQQPAQGSQQNA